MTAIWVEITATRGSSPRDAGTHMRVTADSMDGTIGGGALEFAAINRARKMLSQGDSNYVETIPLGPNLGQCCGGVVTLKYNDQAPEDRKKLEQIVVPRCPEDGVRNVQLWLWGAGHVGRAVVAAAHPDVFTVTWIDSAPERFPNSASDHLRVIPAADMPLLASRAEREADHLIFTYSHDIDLALCAALLKRGVRSCGLIGSETKWTRFQKRLRAMGLDPSPITCPIGDKSLGKAPHQIAQGVVQALLDHQRPKAAI